MVGAPVNVFNFQVLINGYTDDGDLENVLSDDIGFDKLDLRYKVNEYPGGTLVLKASNWILLNKYKSFRIKLLIKGSYAITFDFGVTDRKIVGKDNIFNGLLTHHDKFLTKGSDYLGTDLQTACNRLGFEQDISINRITGKFFRINESKLVCLMKLLQGGAMNSFVVISDSIMKMVSPSTAELYNDELDNMSESMIVLDNYNYMSTYCGDTNNFHNIQLGSEHLFYRDNDSYYKNLIDNTRFSERLNVSTAVQYNTFLPYEVGHRIVVNYDKFKFKKYVIISKQLKLSKNISTTFELGTYKNEFK